MMEIKDYLKIIDDVIAKGEFKDDWDSLSRIKIPDWYQKGRFGLFVHWGVYSVPATESEWYPRLMYLKASPSNRHWLSTYGKDNDYRKLIEKFNPTKFDAKVWIDTFKKSGAKYIMPVAEHHDGVKMYHSDLNKWNMVDLPQHRNYTLELKAAAEDAGLGFLTSSHRAEHYWFFNGARTNYPDSEIAKNLYPDLYGPAVELSNDESNGKKSGVVTKEWLEDWLASSAELIDKTQPLAIYFDWWIYLPDFKPYIKKFLAYYYNRGKEWGKEVGVFYKFCGMMKDCAIYDVERGQIDGIAAKLWQCDTAIAKNSWGYTDGNKFKTTYEVLCNLIDVISKNGCFMLNVGPKADGTIAPEEEAVLLKVGKWLEINGEAIYDARPFDKFGEGHAQKNGAFKENLKYSKKDYRFTYKPNAIYVFPMSNKPNTKYFIKSLKFANIDGIRYDIKGVSILGYNNKVTALRTDKGMTIELDQAIVSDLPICIKISID